MSNEVSRNIGSVVFPNQLISAQNVNLSSTFTTTSTLYVDCGLSASITAKVGDLMVFDCCCPFAQSVGSNGVAIRLLITDGGTDYNPGPSFSTQQVSSLGPVNGTLAGMWVCLTAGTVSVKLQGHANSSTLSVYGGTSLSTSTGAAGTVASSTMRVLQYRP